MEQSNFKIDGDVLVFTDQHIGLKSNSTSRLKIVINVFKDVIKHVKENQVKTVISCGDIFHARNAIDVNTMNVAYKLVSALAKHCKVYLICGNHDIYMKTSTDVNSVNMFQDIENVVVVKDVMQGMLNDKRALLVPWLGNVSGIQKESIDAMFGHFDVSTKYLIKSYAEQNSSRNVSDSLKSQIASDEMLQDDSRCIAQDEIGDFIDVVKTSGVIMSGHIHTRKEFWVKQRKFIFVGSPYQQTLGDIGCKCGFYMLKPDLSYEFHEISDVPKHVELRLSEVMKAGLDNYDFSKVRGNILHKVYDIEVSPQDDAKVSQKIADMQPYEELLPDYEVELKNENDDHLVNESVELLKKSKMQYIMSYIDSIDQKALDEDGIEKAKLLETLEKYYNQVS